MAILTHHTFDDLSVHPQLEEVAAAQSSAELAGAVESLTTVRGTIQAARSLQPIPLAFPESGEDRGFALQSLKLTRGFEGFIGNLFKNDSEVFFLAWSFDLSREEPWLWPGKEFDPETLRSKLDPGDVRSFMGQGALLFPQRRVYGGISLRIQVWESDEELRKIGKTLEEVSNAIKDSKLTNVLSLFALAGGPTTATLALVRDAATELGKIVGAILKGNSNDLVDFFEGYYPVSDAWSPGEETHSGDGSEIVLSRL